MKKQLVTYDVVRRAGLTLANVQESTSYGTPALKVNGRLFVRLHQDRDKIVVKMPFDRREELMAGDPETYFITDHYRDYPWILVACRRFIPTLCPTCFGLPITRLRQRRKRRV